MCDCVCVRVLPCVCLCVCVTLRVCVLYCFRRVVQCFYGACVEDCMGPPADALTQPDREEWTRAGYEVLMRAVGMDEVWMSFIWHNKEEWMWGRAFQYDLSFKYF